MLERIYLNSKYYQVRARDHCIRLSYEGQKISSLMKIFGVSRNTIYNWFNNWDKFSLAGLYNEKGRGRKPLFNSQEKEPIKQWVKESSKKLNRVQERIKEEWEKEVSKETIKRVVKSLKMTWHRLRRRVGGQPDQEEYQEKKRELEELKKQDLREEIDLRYVDESGFCLIPYVPYAWQEKGLTIFWLPTYSPQLNLIEILWKKIKYEWLDASAYDSWTNLVEAVENILKKVGENYTINFV